MKVFSLALALTLLPASAIAQTSEEVRRTDERWIRGGPPGGVVTALVASPRDPGVLFAGTDGGGVFLGAVAGGGAVWSPLGSEVVGGKVLALANAPSNPNVLYASVGELPAARGVWKSADRGATWTPVSRGLPGPPPFCSCGSLVPVNALAVHPHIPRIVYAAAGGGVYKTINGGLSWFPAGGGFSAGSLAIDPVVPSIVYAGASDGVYKSTNGGRFWTRMSTGLRQRTVAALLLDPEDRQVLFAATPTGVFRSRDAGLHWQFVGSMPPVSSLAAAPSTVWAGTASGVWRSTDGGSTWQRTSGGLRNLPVRALAVSPAQPRVVWAGTGVASFQASLYGPGVFRSADAGTTWRVSNRGLFAARITSLGVSPEHPGAVLGTDGAGVFFEEASGWVARNRGLTERRVLSMARDPIDPEIVYAGTAHGVFRTVNEGRDWEPRNAGLPVGPLGLPGVRDLVVDPDDPDVLYAATHLGIFRSADGAATWTQLPVAVTAPVEDLALDPEDSRVIYAAAGKLLRSADGGATWAELPLPPGETALAVTVDPSDKDRLFAGSFGRVLRSADGGQTWEIASLPAWLAVQALAAGLSPEQVWAGTTQGLYQSGDGGATWSRVQETRGASVTDVAANVLGPGSVLAATLGAGLFERQGD